ncbi:hypothetical protein BV898_19399, partial [Hypsibius exemplaris]
KLESLAVEAQRLATSNELGDQSNGRLLTHTQDEGSFHPASSDLSSVVVSFAERCEARNSWSSSERVPGAQGSTSRIRPTWMPPSKTHDRRRGDSAGGGTSEHFQRNVTDGADCQFGCFPIRW